MGLFSNPSKKAIDTIGQIPAAVKPQYDPYMDAGKKALGTAADQYNALLGNPGGKVNEIGASWKGSPGLEAALNNSERAAGHAAAAGGMLGSPQHQYNAMKDATDITNQDYYNYLSKALGLYGNGLEGNQNLVNGGQKSAGDYASMIADALSGKAGFEYAGAAAKNTQKSAFISQITQLIAAYLGQTGQAAGAAAGAGGAG